MKNWNLQFRNVQVEISCHTNCILTNIGYSATLLRKMQHGREIEFSTVLFDNDLLFLLMK